MSALSSVSICERLPYSHTSNANSCETQLDASEPASRMDDVERLLFQLIVE
jgi:hypothetical protein